MIDDAAAESASPENENPPPKRRRLRWWPAIVVIALPAIPVALIFASPDNTAQTRNAVLQAYGLLCIVGLTGWWLLLSRASWRSRGVVALIFAAVALFLVFSIRRVGVTGDLWLDPEWRWSRLPADSAGPGTGSTASESVDLQATTPNDFPQFLGPHRNGTVSGLTLSRDWQATPPEQLWERAVGSGWSSFAVVNGSAVTQEQHGNQQSIVCYDVEKGDVRWSHSYPSEFHSVLGGDGPRATPTIDRGLVFCLGPNGQLTCLEGSDGSNVWSRNVLEDSDTTNKEYGISCSPLVWDERVIVAPDGANGRSLVAYDRTTGEIIWHAGDDPAGYSSPCRMTLAGVEQVVILNDNSVAGHDPETGQIRWRHPWAGEDAKIPQPHAWRGDKLLVTSGFGAGSELIELSPGDDADWQIQSLWKNRALKPKFTNVVIHGDHVYGLDNGILTCLEMATGKRSWKSGRYRHGQVLLVGDLLLVQSEFGELFLVEASPDEHRQLAHFPAIEGRTWNNPALFGEFLLVRNDRVAACFRLPVETPTGDTSTDAERPAE